MKTDYYIYAFIDPRTDTPFYIGAGRGKRAYRKRKKGTYVANKIAKMQREDVQHEVHFVLEGLTRDEAFQVWEPFLIAALGRISLGTGPLCNFTAGGDGFVDLSPEAKARYAAAMADPEVKARRVAAMKAAMADPEVKARHAAAMADPEVKARHAAALTDPEVKARHVAAVKAAWADPEVKARRVAAMADPEKRAQVLAAKKVALADSEVKARCVAALADPEMEARYAAAVKAAWVRQKVKENQENQGQMT